MELIHMNLAVSDINTAVKFYTEQLGFEETWGFESEGIEHRYVAADNGVEIQLSKTEEQTDFDHGDAYDHLAIRVEDVDSAYNKIDHFGVVKEPDDQPEAGARTAFIYDPDGYKVELVEFISD